MHIVREGDWYPVLSISDTGWYEIRITKDLSGYISPNLVSRLYYGIKTVATPLFAQFYNLPH